MKKQQTYEVLTTIVEYYRGFLDLTDTAAVQRKMDTWHRVLKDKEFDTIIENLTNYVEVNKFPPSLSDLLEVEPLRGRGVKTAAETLEMLQQHESEKPAEPIDPRTLPEWKELGEMLRKGAGR